MVKIDNKELLRLIDKVDDRHCEVRTASFDKEGLRVVERRSKTVILAKKQGIIGELLNFLSSLTNTRHL